MKRANTRGEALFACIIALLVLVAAGAKAAAFGQFEATVWLSGFLPRALVPVSCGMVILAESAVGLALIVPGFRRAGAAGLVLLACVFIEYSLWRAVAHSPELCSCFGTLFRMSPFEAGLADAVLLAAGLCLGGTGRRLSEDPSGLARDCWGA